MQTLYVIFTELSVSKFLTVVLLLSISSYTFFSYVFWCIGICLQVFKTEFSSLMDKKYSSLFLVFFFLPEILLSSDINTTIVLCLSCLSQWAIFKSQTNSLLVNSSPVWSYPELGIMLERGTSCKYCGRNLLLGLQDRLSTDHLKFPVTSLQETTNQIWFRGCFKIYFLMV